MAHPSSTSVTGSTIMKTGGAVQYRFGWEVGHARYRGVPLGQMGDQVSSARYTLVPPGELRIGDAVQHP